VFHGLAGGGNTLACVLACLVYQESIWMSCTDSFLLWRGCREKHVLVLKLYRTVSNQMKKRMILVVALFFSVMAVADTNPASPSLKNHAAVTPVPRPDAWWTQRHEAVLERVKQGNVDLLMIGDSITHGWESVSEIWAKYYAPRNAVNLGYGGDQTQHVLWRLDNGEIDGISPKLAVIMIGTNNSNGEDYTAEQIADGIVAIIEKLQVKLPKMKVLVLGIFPRAEKPCPQREKNAKASELAAKYIAAETAKGNKGLFYLDIGSKFLAADGTLPKEIMPDFLHPNAKGYQIWAEAMEPKIAELMGGK
jgi:lysophospholipase L1-like esterase